MAIYIKGMDMPTNCTDCCYRPLVWCNPYQDNGLSPSDHRHSTCPLTEVAEPSGDLISRADAIERFCECGTSLERQGKTIITMVDAKYAFIETLESLPSAEAETVDCTEFIRWLTETVMDDGMWELNAVAYGEVIARKLTKLGVLEVKDDVYVYKPSAEAKTKCIAQIKVDTEEIVRRIKEECDITDGWIPCKERLPEENGEYIVSLEDSVYPWARFFNGKWFMLPINAIAREFGEYEVIAWMPLPEPYREEKQNG